MPAPALDWFNPTILAPSFVNPVTNAAAEEETDYLERELSRHLFHRYVLDGAEMYDAHGVRRALAAAFDVRESSLGDGATIVPDLARILADRAARRVAILVRNADRPIEADMQRFATILTAVESAARRLWPDDETIAESVDASSRTQLLLLLLGPPPSFSMIDPVAKRRAAAQSAVKLMAADVTIQPWSRPGEFDLAASHRLTFSHADWYYRARGRRAGDGRTCHCIEGDDRLCFIRASDDRPLVEATFARIAAGIQLVGLRYEMDESILRLEPGSDDAFTLFRRLCDECA
jgi:hypothetical protein